MSYFGDQLKAYLAERGTTPHDVALRIGIDASYMSKIINGSKPPSKKVFKKLASLEDLKLDIGTVIDWWGEGVKQKLREDLAQYIQENPGRLLELALEEQDRRKQG